MKLSKKHGVNPTLSVCFYCEKETGEIALLGASYKGEAPKHMVTSFEPCTECKAKYTDHHMFIEINPIENKPTGRWAYVNDKDLTPETKKQKQIIFCTPAIFEKNFKIEEKNDTN